MTRSFGIRGGSMTALATPFKNGTLDAQSFVRLCDRQIACGTTGLVVCGSTGEAPALRIHELTLLFRLAVSAAGGRVPVIAGCGGPSTAAAQEVAEAAAGSGVTALLCAPTPYVKPSQAGIVAHMQALKQASGLPLILYDVPGRTGVALQDETIATLFKQGLAFGLKDATADLGRPVRLRALCGDGLLQLSGDDATAAAYRAAGGDGCISVTANLTPVLCAVLHHSWDRGDLDRFAFLRDLLAPLHDALFVESNPVPLKAGLAILGLAADEVRLPLLPALDGTRRRLDAVLHAVMEEEHGLGQETAHALAS